MANAKVRLRGRFSPGTIVRLVEVPGEHTLRAEGGREIDTKKVNDDGEVTFSTGVKDGARYFVTGYVDGFPLEVRVRGRSDVDDDTVNSQSPVGPDRQRLSDGSFLDEPPEARDAPKFEAAPGLAQEQAGDVVQRSSTPRGTAHPVDTDEQTPKPRQEDAKGIQMSDTETGDAAPLAVGPQRQEDVGKGVWQRSDTPTGVATPLPTRGAVQAQQDKESSEGKAMRGEPGRVATEPVEKAKPVKGASGKQSEKRDAELKESETEAGEVEVEDTEDAMGQPVAGAPKPAPRKSAAKRRATKSTKAKKE